MDEVTLDVEAEFKLLAGTAFNGIPVIANRRLKSKVRLATGEWAAVAGLMNHAEARTIAGLAGLNPVPVLGALTSQHNHEDTGRHVLLVMRPRLVTPPPTRSSPTRSRSVPTRTRGRRCRDCCSPWNQNCYVQSESRKDGATMTCGFLMTKDPACCLPTDSVARAAKVMKTQDVGSLPVCESRDSRRLVGIITDRDLAVNVVADGRDANNTRVQDVMTREPFTCRAEDDLQNALDAMQKYQVRRIPIIDGSGHLIGIIAQADIAVRGKEPEKTAETVGKISKPSTAHA